MRCTLKYENALRRTGLQLIAGIDEAGRGPLAGPVVAAAVILPMGFRHAEIDDSKKLTAELREEIYAALTARGDVCWAVAIVEHEEVDRINILRAAHEAMRRAVRALATLPEHALIDGLPVRPFPVPHTAIVKGDGQSKSIAAASILAKVTRDRIMVGLDAEYPSYGFAQHKGYATELHLERLKVHGPCPIHRRTFLPVAQQLLDLAC
jgi:ribonuclease HII